MGVQIADVQLTIGAKDQLSRGLQTAISGENEHAKEDTAVHLVAQDLTGVEAADVDLAVRPKGNTGGVEQAAAFIDVGGGRIIAPHRPQEGTTLGVVA